MRAPDKRRRNPPRCNHRVWASIKSLDHILAPPRVCFTFTVIGNYQTHPLNMGENWKYCEILGTYIQNFASKWRWGIVRNDSFLFHKAHHLRFPITFRIHFVIIRSLFIYHRLLIKELRQNFNENYLQLSRIETYIDRHTQINIIGTYLYIGIYFCGDCRIEISQIEIDSLLVDKVLVLSNKHLDHLLL